MRLSESEKTILLFAVQERVNRLKKSVKNNPKMEPEMRETKDLLDKILVIFVSKPA